MKALRTLVILSPLLLAGCATQAVSLSTLDNAGTSVTAEISKFNILGLTPMPIEIAAELLDDLNEQCGGAGVTGLTTRTSTIYAIIGLIEKVEATGYCKTG